MKVLIHQAKAGEIAELARAARAMYVEHFTYLWSSENLLVFLEKYYSTAYFQAFFEEEDSLVWIARAEGTIAGFMFYRRNRMLHNEEGGAQVQRIYLSAEFAGKGIGKRLMQKAYEQAEEDARKYLFLDVMHSSKESIRFYEKQGFEIVGGRQFTDIAMRSPESGEMWYMRKGGIER